jgi:hypothetical protein
VEGHYKLPQSVAGDALPEFIPNGRSPGLLLICDPASNQVPRDFSNLGLDPLALNHHIAIDVCTRLEDSVTVAALYVCIISMLHRLRRDNQRWRIYPRSLVDENLWLAQQFGITRQLVDFGLGRMVEYADLL